jgi:hypothetical protein
MNIVTVHRFRVKDKEGIKDPKFPLKMLIQTGRFSGNGGAEI